ALFCGVLQELSVHPGISCACETRAFYVGAAHAAEKCVSATILSLTIYCGSRTTTNRGSSRNKQFRRPARDRQGTAERGPIGQRAARCRVDHPASVPYNEICALYAPAHRAFRRGGC